MSGDLLSSVRTPGRQALGEILLGLRKIDSQQLANALQEQQNLNQKLGDVLVAKGYISRKDLDYALALQQQRDPEGPALARKKLGDLLLDSGRISTAQLEAALEEQSLTSKKIGEVLIEMGFVSTQELETTLHIQDSFRRRNVNRLAAPSAHDPLASLQEPPAVRFRKLVGREFASAEEALAVTRALEGKDAEAFEAALQVLSQLQEEWLQPFAAARRNPAIRPQLLATENELLDLIKLVKERQDLQNYWDRLFHEWTYTRKKIAEEADRVHRLELAKIKKQQLMARMQDMIFNLLGNVPPKLLNKVMEMISKAADGGNLDQLEAKLADLIEMILRLFQKMKGESPSSGQLEKLLEAALDGLDMGAAGPGADSKLEQMLSKLIAQMESPSQGAQSLDAMLQQLGGGSPLGGMSMTASPAAPTASGIDAMLQGPGLGNLLGQAVAGFGAPGSAPGLQAQMPQASAANSRANANRDAVQSLGATTPPAPAAEVDTLSAGVAMELVSAMNYRYRGITTPVASADDPWVQALLSGQETPETMEASFHQYYAGERRGIEMSDALDFIGHMNRTYRSLEERPAFDDPWVHALVNGQSTPAEVEAQWKDYYAQTAV
ncbi:bacteriophage N4 adsorption protein B [compost metagenome]